MTERTITECDLGAPGVDNYDEQRKVGTAMSSTPRQPMAPDTEPTDEELATVMREAREVAMQRKAESDQKVRALLEEAVREALARPRRVSAR